MDDVDVLTELAANSEYEIIRNIADAALKLHTEHQLGGIDELDLFCSCEALITEHEQELEQVPVEPRSTVIIHVFGMAGIV